MRVDLNLLRVLDALLQERSTVRAGERLGLSQPAVSAALGRLRLVLDDQLFFRKGQGLEPTDYALSLAEPLAQALQAVERVLRRPDPFDPAVSTARFRISGSDFFAEMLMPQLADRLAVAAPGVRVHLVDLVPDNYVDTLDRYEVDIALLPRTALPGWIEGRRVFSSTFSVIARKGHPRLAGAGIAPGDVVPLDLFCDLGHVIFSVEGNDSAMGDLALERIGRTRRVVMTLPVFSGVYCAVAGSDLIGLLPSTLAHRVRDMAGFDIYEAPVALDRADIMMIWHKRHSANPAHRWMREQIAGLLRPLDATDI